MNNYREIYDKLLSELEVLKIKRGELDNEYSEISADYDNVQDEYDSRMNDIYLKQQSISQMVLKSTLIPAFTSITALIILITYLLSSTIPVLNFFVLFVLSTTLPFLIDFPIIKKIFSKRVTELKNEKNEISNFYEEKLGNIKKSMLSLSKEIQMLDNAIENKNSDINLLLNECGKLYMGIIDTQTNTLENENKPYVKKRIINDK